MPKITFGALLVALAFDSYTCYAQTIATFNSVQPTAQTQNLVLPSTHTFQRIIKTGDQLSLGGTLGTHLDFTGYVPISGSSTNGRLSISSESVPAECAILDVNFNTSTRLWNTSASGKVNFPFADIGNIAAFCSGTVTPRNTVMVCEEVTPAGDHNGDGYHDLGWVIEIDPATRKVINQDKIGGVDKLWAVGRQAHENVALNANETIMYWGADAVSTGYVYKFVPNTAATYTSGKLYVLQTTSALGTGTWKLVANTTIAERNNVIAASTAQGAYNFNGVEDVEIGPDGKIYFTAKSSGRVYRFRDVGTTVDQLQVFVESKSYDVDGTGPFPSEPWGTGADNLAFDGQGNLWVLQDGSAASGNRNHIWVVAPTHTATSPKVRLFATTPAGSEPTGITFSPDKKYLFMSFMHPSTSNTQAQRDAAGQNVVFNTHTTVVISRRENLGMWPRANISSPTITEGNTGSKNVTFNVTLDRSFAVPVSMKYRTLSNNAGTQDYTPKSGTVTFPANSVSQPVIVSIRGDVLDEVNETFRVVLSEPVNALLANATGTCTITDDDAAPAIRIMDTTTSESRLSATVRLSLSAISGKTVQVQYDTKNGTAIAPGDYTAVVSGSMSFSPGQKDKYINIAVKKDAVTEATETFQVALKNPVNATILSSAGAKPTATIRISNSTAAATANALIDEAVLQVQVFNNPGAGEFGLLVDGPQPVSLVVRDLLGKTVESRRILQTGAVQQLGVAWQPGIYIAEIWCGNQRKNIRLVKTIR